MSRGKLSGFLPFFRIPAARGLGVKQKKIEKKDEWKNIIFVLFVTAPKTTQDGKQFLFKIFC